MTERAVIARAWLSQFPGWLHGRRARGATELLLVLVVPALVLLAVGAARWTPPNTPDSEFYLSLSSFGHQITDRAVTPAYYWTRLGVIAPLRLFTHVLGVDAGYALWRWLLLSVAVVPAYYLGRSIMGRGAGAAGAAVVGLNTVFLTVVANPYPTGAVVAILAGEVAVLGLAMGTSGARQRGLLVSAGALVGWVAMCNQIAGVYGVLVAVPFAVVLLARRPRHGITGLVFAAGAAVTVFLGLLFVGTILFPQLVWWATTRYYLTALNPGAFHSDDLGWLAASPALLVLLAVVGLALFLAKRWVEGRILLLAASAAVALSVVFAAWNQFVSSGILLETPIYVAFLWGPALALGAVCVIRLAGPGSRGWVAAGVVVLASALVGRLATASFEVWPAGVAVLVALGAVCMAGVLLAPRTAGAGALLAVAMFAIGIQVLQNGTPRDTQTVSARIPYTAAYRNLGATEGYALDLTVERWVIESTAPTEKVLVWSPDPLLGGVAAMNLNGPNAVSMVQTINAEQASFVGSVAPVRVLIIARSPSGISRLFAVARRASLDLVPGPCTTFSSPGIIRQVVACLSLVKART